MLRKTKWTMAGALALVATLVAPVEAGPDRINTLCQRTCGDAPKICNCSPFEVEIEFCHIEEVVVAVSLSAGAMFPAGGGLGGFSSTVTAKTGQSSSTCAKAAVPPGQCVWMRYCFLCCPKTGLFTSGWACLPDGSSIQGSSATPEDCGERS